MSNSRPSLADAKTRLDVPALWRLLSLPGEPGRSCRCPLHDDSSASFSVYAGTSGRLRWKCHSGCGSGGPVELLARVFDIDEREACRRLREMAAGNSDEPLPARRSHPAPVPPPARRLVLPPQLHPGSEAELRSLANLRRVSTEGVELAQARGLLWFAPSRGCPSWIVTDQARTNAQARRLDGKPWEHIGAKAWTLPGSRAAWPIGTPETAHFPFAVIVEGGPDLLAAHGFIAAEGRTADVAACAILGASNQIPEEALSRLQGIRVRLFPHADDAGQKAAIRWTGQLEKVGCTVDAFRFDGLRRIDGGAVKDLNDLTCLASEYRHEISEVLPR